MSALNRIGLAILLSMCVSFLSPHPSPIDESPILEVLLTAIGILLLVWGKDKK